MKYPKPTSKRELKRRIARGELLLNGEAALAADRGLGELYRLISGDIALRAFAPHPMKASK